MTEEKPIKPIFEEEPLSYPIICIPTLNAQGTRSLAIGFGIVPREKEYRDHSQLGRQALNMLAIAVGGTGMFSGRVPIPSTRRYASPVGNRHGGPLRSAPIPPRRGIAGPPPVAPEPEPSLTPKDRKERQRQLEKKLAARRKAKA